MVPFVVCRQHQIETPKMNIHQSDNYTYIRMTLNNAQCFWDVQARVTSNSWLIHQDTISHLKMDNRNEKSADTEPKEQDDVSNCCEKLRNRFLIFAAIEHTMKECNTWVSIS